MTALLVLLISPLLCLGAAIKRQDEWTVVNRGSQTSCHAGPNACTVLRNTLKMLEAASTTYQCPACDCNTASAEETCVAYVASVVVLCSTSSSRLRHQAGCVKKELSSGFPANMVPCSSDAAVCAAIASFAKTTAATFALTCAKTSAGQRDGRFLGHIGHIKHLSFLITRALGVTRNPVDRLVNDLDNVLDDDEDEDEDEDKDDDDNDDAAQSWPF